MAALQSAEALARVFPEGQKLTGFCLDYGCELDPSSVSPSVFAVTDRSLEPAVPPEPLPVLRAEVRGSRVLLDTDPSCRGAWAIMNWTHGGQPNPFGPPLNFPGGPERTAPSGPPPAGGPDPVKMGYTGPKPLHIELHQTQAIRTAEGQTVPPGSVFCTRLTCPETERFQQMQFEDMPFSLFIPEQAGSGPLPLVIFVPDASARGTDPTVPLRQGIGGVVWTSPEDQARHPCFVACPAFAPEELLTRDDFTCQPRLYRIKDLADFLLSRYSIDPDRIYLTGQSMGCMTACELMCTWPDFFAGGVLAAGQWDPVRCGRALARQNLWILVSENDRKAHAGMDAVTAAIQENGGTVARFLWDGRADPETLDALAREALKTEAGIRYSLFKGDSVVPPGEAPSPGACHTCTWRTAYSIPAVRDWLFTVRRNP